MPSCIVLVHFAHERRRDRGIELAVEQHRENTALFADMRALVEAFAHCGTRIAVLESEPVAVSLWDTETGVPVLRLTETNAYPTIDRSGRWLTTIGADRILTVRDTIDGSVLYSFQSERTREAQASPDGQLVVAIDDLQESRWLQPVWTYRLGEQESLAAVAAD